MYIAQQQEPCEHAQGVVSSSLDSPILALSSVSFETGWLSGILAFIHGTDDHLYQHGPRPAAANCRLEET